MGYTNKLFQEILEKYMFDIHENIKSQTPNLNGEYKFISNRIKNKDLIHNISIGVGGISILTKSICHLPLFTIEFTSVKQVIDDDDRAIRNIMHCKIIYNE